MNLTTVKSLNRKRRAIRQISSISCSCFRRHYNIRSTKIIRRNHQIHKLYLNQRFLKQRNLNKLIRSQLIRPTTTIIISINTISFHPICPNTPPPQPEP
ncbi:hypothetical protein HanXRQr2_Chr15g0685061 [Helianthus annuus]|uniref:Uncharacterized protein n=1 Tax=Helianthus annuus TaxID=4232 RepID=A0A9K3DZ69_HELAN|nr:hypothetical protein HanXRQr2_Chr15g0685061 [Helianthus annuus]